MKYKFFIVFVFWWSMFFPTLSFNNFTTDIYDKNVKYSDLYSKDLQIEILENAEYDFWLKSCLFSGK